MNPSIPPGDAIDLTDYLSGLARYRVFILLVTLACAAVAAVVVLRAPRSYVASVTLAVTQPKFGVAPNEVGSVSPASFRPLLESRTNAVAVMHDLGLDRAPYNLPVSVFLSSVITIEEVRGTNLIKVTATFGDPQRATQIAQRVGERAVALAQKVNVDEATRARDFINEQLGLAKSRLDRAQGEFIAYQDGAQIEALRKDVEATLSERGDILNLLVEIETEKARLAVQDEELTKRKRIDVLKKSIDTEPALADAARARAGTGTSAIGAQLQTESISTVFEELDSDVAATRTNLAVLEKQKAQLVDLRHLDAPALAQLSLLYKRAGQLARLQVELDLAQKIYVDVASRFEAARLQVGARSPQLEVLDPAVVPDRPESRNLLRDTVFAALVGLSASALVAMFLQAVRAAAGRRATGR